MKTFPLLDFGLGETANLMRESVQEFVGAEIAPIASDIDRNDEFPPELWQKMGAMGLLGITVADKYGGAGMGYLEHVIAMEEISRGSASVGLAYGAHSDLCVNQIKLNGTEEQKERYLPGLISGKYIGALAMSEEGAGSEPSRIHATENSVPRGACPLFERATEKLSTIREPVCTRRCCPRQWTETASPPPRFADRLPRCHTRSESCSRSSAVPGSARR